jgi:hypothetical protein
VTLFAGDEYEDGDVTSGPADSWTDAGGWDWGEPYDDGPGLDWDDGLEPSPSRRVVTIETTGERL